MPLQDEERLFIEAIRDLNYQASKLQAEENQVMCEEKEGLNFCVRERFQSNGDIQETIVSVRPVSPLSSLAALATASAVDDCASKTLDLAATAVMQAAQKVNHNPATYNLEGALSWIQAQREDMPLVFTSPNTSSALGNAAHDSNDHVDNNGGSNTTDEEDDGTLIPGSKRKNKKITLSKRSFSTYCNSSEEL